MADMSRTTLAIDFGTSNSAAALLDRGRVIRVPLEDRADTLPTAIFLPADGGPMLIGASAGAALIGGEEGRYMRALKSVLGTELFHEDRLVSGRRRSLADIVTAFLAEVKSRAEAVSGRRFDRVVAGRPVHFHPDPARDRRAQDDLAACYRAAGFEALRFVAEPEAAALADRGAAGQGLGLVVDIGGGTSDFTLFRQAGQGAEILSSHGIRLGGTDFDQSISLARVMPLLGHGGELRREMGPGLLPMPRAIFVDLASWPRIPFLYTPETRRAVADLRRRAVDPAALDRLGAVLEHELGHEIAFAVERAKIAANGAEGRARIGLGFITPGLAATLDAAALDAALDDHAAVLAAALRETLERAGQGPQSIARAVLVGGSSLMALVARAVAANLPRARLERADAFTAVVDGLALAIERPIGTPA